MSSWHHFSFFSPTCGISRRSPTVLRTFQLRQRSRVFNRAKPSMFVRGGGCEVNDDRTPNGLAFSGGLRSVDCWPLAKNFNRFRGVNLTGYPLTSDRRDPGWGILLSRWVCRRSPTPSRAAGPLGRTTPWGTQWGQLDGLWGTLLNRGDVPEAGLGSVPAPAI